MIIGHTVDGSEIRRAPVEVGSLSHYLKAFFFSSQLFSRISEPSTESLGHVAPVQDSHQDDHQHDMFRSSGIPII